MRMLSVHFRLYLPLAVLLSAFFHADTLPPSHHDDPATIHGLNNGTPCSWNCTDIDSYLMEEVKTVIAKNRIIQLVVKYEAMGECVDQTYGNSSGNITEHFRIWRANKQLSVFTKALESVLYLMYSTDSVEEHKEIKAKCTLRHVNTTATEPTHYNGSSPIFFRSHLADLGVKFDSIDCNTETADNLQTCGNNISTLEGLLEHGWPMIVLVFLNVGFVAVFTYYSPAFVCIFSPTEVSEDGVHQIALDGASPVSLRSLIGNYFFSKEDTIWHRVRMFILRGVVFPFPFVGPAMFIEHVQQKLSWPIHIFGVRILSDLWHASMIVSCLCYYIMACYMSFFSARSSGGNPCIVCKRIKSKTLICQAENLPKRIINHLRIQPLILVKCWRLFIRLLLTYFKRSFHLISSAFEFSSSFFLRLFFFIVLLSAIPAVTVILLILVLWVLFAALFFTCPVYILCATIDFAGHNVYFRSVCILISTTAAVGTTFSLAFAGSGVSIIIMLASEPLLSEESLPFVACFVLVLYYLWSSYSSFTNKYQDLGLALFKHHKSYKKSRNSQVTYMNLNRTDSLPENTENVVGNKDNLMKIPKELFRMACEELMPIRESVCVLILKVTIIVSFVFFVFSMIMLHNISATPVMRALMTFLSGSLPKIIAIYMDGRRQKNIEAMTADEKIPLIVQEYFEGISEVNQGQENSGVDVDVELLQNANEENIELEIM